MPFSILSELIESMKKLDIQYVALSGGEPLLHSNLQEIVMLLNEHHIIVDIVINGSRLIAFEDVLNFVGHIQISLDGASSITNDLIRGQGNFENIVAQIKCLNQNIKNKITLKMVLNAHNCDEIIDYINLAERLNIRRVSFGWVNDLRRAKGNQNLSIDDKDMLRVIRLINEQKDQRKNIEVVPLGTTDRCHYVNKEELDTIKVSLRIDSNGDIYPCQLISCKQFILGNLFDMKLSDLLNCERVNSFFEFAKKRQSNIR